VLNLEVIRVNTDTVRDVSKPYCDSFWLDGQVTIPDKGFESFFILL
jgi:hypothetical protein